uniref:GAIN-B domain-containing protein n=1 Tax=Sphenodon punctatus TaxID=8508 RepID=A0A8D0HIF6_SPHPU
HSIPAQLSEPSVSLAVFSLAGLLSYKGLEPILAEAAIEGEEWEQLQKEAAAAREPAHPGYKVLSQVASAFVGHEETENLSSPVTFLFSHSLSQQEPRLGRRMLCAFWEPHNGGGRWSTRGCRVLFSDASSTQCSCTHLTSFAVLMAFYELEVSLGPGFSLGSGEESGLL